MLCGKTVLVLIKGPLLYFKLFPPSVCASVQQAMRLLALCLQPPADIDAWHVENFTHLEGANTRLGCEVTGLGEVSLRLCDITHCTSYTDEIKIAPTKETRVKKI